MADALILAQLCAQIRTAADECKTNKKRVGQLADRVEWYREKFAQVNQIDAVDYQPVSAMKALLEDILQFIHTTSIQLFAVTSLYKTGSDRDAIDDFHIRLDRARDDLLFVFAVVKPSSTQEPFAVCVGEEVDYNEQLAELRSNSEALRSELAQTNLNVERLVQIVQAKYNASIARSQALLSGETTFASSPGRSRLELNSDDFKPRLSDLSVHDHRGLWLGEGAFGNVFKARHKGIHVVAVKMIKTTVSDRAKKELLNELDNMDRAGFSRNIVPVIGVYIGPDRLCLVTSFAHGGSLKKRLDTRSEVSWSDNWRWAKDVASGMAWLHACTPPIIHRDLKADNVLLDEDNRAMVADFGCARAKTETVNKTGAFTSSGSRPWMPPEAFKTGEQGLPGDVYGFGCVMWEMATGETPWFDVSADLIIPMVTNGSRPNTDNIAETKFVSIMTSCWDQNKDDRPSFSTVLALLGEKQTPEMFLPKTAENPMEEMIVKLKGLQFEDVEARALASKLMDGGCNSVNKLKGERLFLLESLK